MPLALLPPMPLLSRLVLGLVAAILAGFLNLVFCRAHWRLGQLVLAAFVAPLVVYLASLLGLNSDQSTEYALLGAIVGICVVRGAPPRQPIPSFQTRAAILLTAVILLGPVIGLVAHFLRYLVDSVTLNDSQEIQLSLLDGIVTSVAGTALAALMIILAKRRVSKPNSQSKAAETDA